MFFVFFFKQKTAYEMRISDWSSDVCSSDLRHIVPHAVRLGPDNLHLLGEATFVFLCLDSAVAKAAIIAELERLDLPFIDVGMGLHLVDGALVDRKSTRLHSSH